MFDPLPSGSGLVLQGADLRSPFKGYYEPC